MKRQIPKDRDWFYNEVHGVCPYCDEPIARDNFHIDHIRPLSLGGSNGKQNLTAVCPQCNYSKNDKPLRYWLGVKGFEITKDSPIWYKRKGKRGVADIDLRRIYQTIAYTIPVTRSQKIMRWEMIQDGLKPWDRIVTVQIGGKR